MFIASLEQLSQIIDHIIIQLDTDYRIQTLNHKAQQVFGVESSAVRGKPYWELWKGCYQPCPFSKNLISIFDNGVVRNIKASLTTSNHEEKNYNWSAAKIYNKAGEIEGFWIVGEDNPQYCEALKREANLQQNIQDIFRHIPGYLYWKDVNSVYLGCNENFAKAAGLKKPEDIIGKTDFDLAWGKTEAELFRAGDRAVLRGEYKLDFEEPQLMADGRRRTVLASKVPLKDASGQTVGILGIYQDITARKKAEHQLQEARDQAEVASRAKTEFLANMTHDLKTPLHSVLGMTEILKHRDHSEEQEEYLNAILQSGKSILHLVNRILNYSKLESGGLQFKQEPLDLKLLIQDIVRGIQSQLRSSVTMNFDFPAKIPHIVRSDPQAIRRIISNLLGNAVKFTEKGEITLSVVKKKQSKDKVWFHFTVKDTGIGISSKNINQIFDRFYRVDPAYHGKYLGSGLGLTIAKQLVEGLGGSIAVESRLKKGSTFICELPLLLADAVELNRQIKESKIITKAKEFVGLTVLLVEDNLYSTRVTRIMLENYGCIVEMAVTGAEALQRIREKPYSLIFMDVGLPDCSGIEVTQKIRSDANPNQKTYICALTAHAREEDRQCCLKAGMNNFLSIPAGSNDFKKILKQARKIHKIT